MNIHQVLSGAGPHDAVTTQALLFRSWFRAWGWRGGDHAARIAPGVNGSIRGLARLKAGPDDVILIHHSAEAPRLDELLEQPNPKLLFYHNVTPAWWLWDHAPLVAVHCAIGRDQLPHLVEAVDVAAAASEYSAAELRSLGAARTEVIPLVIDREGLGAPGADHAGPAAGSAGPAAGNGAPLVARPTILFVGRLSPHKRQDEVIRVFSLYRRHHAPDARLVLVGEPITPAYADALRELADGLAPGAVQIETGLSTAEIGERYRAADAFLCLSEHEGFCLPVLEALHFGVPVIARTVGGVPEVAGNAALLIGERDPAVIAELLRLVLADGELRGELRRRGTERAAQFTPARVAARLRAAVEAAAEVAQARTRSS